MHKTESTTAFRYSIGRSGWLTLTPGTDGRFLLSQLHREHRLRRIDDLAVNLAQVFDAGPGVDRMNTRTRVVQGLHCKPSGDLLVALQPRVKRHPRAVEAMVWQLGLTFKEF